MFDAFADRAGAHHSATLRTGLTFADALGIAEQQIRDLETRYSDDYFPSTAPDYNQALLLLQLANGAWDRALISAELAGTIDAVVAASSLRLKRNPWSGGQGPSVLAVTEGVDSKLWSRASTELARNLDSACFGSVSSDLFAEIFAEGILDWVAGGAVAATRKCALDGRWFTPKVRNRARFCNDECRKRFNKLRVLADVNGRTFECVICEELSEPEMFSGLRTEGDAEPPQLRMTPWSRDGAYLVCIDCVISKFPAWAPYVQAFAGGERT